MDYRKRIYDAYVSKSLKYTGPIDNVRYEGSIKYFRRRFMPFLPQNKDARILDLACGTGRFLYFLQKEGYSHAQGIDISQEAVDLAERMGVKNIEVGDLFEMLPHRKEEFDFIFAAEFIEHLRKDEVLGFLDLVHAALKPGGRTLMTTPNAASLFGARAAFFDFTHETAFTPQSLAEVFRVCGFENVMVYGAEPVVRGLLSGVRAILWKPLKAVVKAYLLIDGSTGFGVWNRGDILSHGIFVVGSRPNG
jgi:2-polyprenyl-3-methyl-5-hydroxy-6-metoxy-1,4-benzoquinol methylase